MGKETQNLAAGRIKLRQLYDAIDNPIKRANNIIDSVLRKDLLLSLYLRFIFFLYLDLYVVGDDALIS